jgi:hypothetical protein
MASRYFYFAARMRFHYAFSRGWERREFRLGPDRPAHQFAAAVGAARTGQAVPHTVHTESALERADHRVARIWRQVLVAALAIRLQHQHLKSPPTRVGLLPSRAGLHGSLKSALRLAKFLFRHLIAGP